MFKNYLRVALQQLRRQPVFSFIKIFSLTLGLVCSILVITHVYYTYSYNKFFPEWQNIYRLVTSFTTDQRLNTPMIADAYFTPLLNDYAQIESGAKILESNGLFSRGNESATNSYQWIDPQFIEIFSLEFVQGDAETALDEVFSVVLSESTARKYFGDADPMGQVLTLDSQHDLRVTGILRDLPGNTHFDIQILLSAETGRSINDEGFLNRTTWAGYQGTQGFFVIPSPAEAAAIESDLDNFIDRNVPDQQRDFVNQIDVTLSLEPLADIYLSPRNSFRGGGGPQAQILAGLSLFAVLILVTSCINFANLSLSQIQQRGREIGVRKTLGATRANVVVQILFESLILTLIALLIALPILFFLTPVYTALTGTSFTLATVVQTGVLGWLLLFVVATAVLSGLVPALSMARFQAADIVKGLRYRGRVARWVRSAITVVQFSFAGILIILAIGIGAQIRFLQEMDVGFNRSNLVILDTMFDRSNTDAFDYDALVNDLLQHPAVVSVGKSESRPPNTGGYNPWRRPEWPQGQVRPVSHFAIDENFIETYQFELLAGRVFSEEFPADFMPPGQPDPEQTYGVVITPAAVRNFEFDSAEAALNQQLGIGNLNFRVVGVVDTFRLGGGLEDVLRSTSILRASSAPMRTLSIRINPDRLDEVLSHIDSTWERHRPNIPIDRTFYEQTYEQLVYEQTNSINMASRIAALITIIIAAMGLYALAFYSSQRRTKEVGIRKVMGATSHSIVGLLAWDFLKPVAVACVIGCLGGYLATVAFLNQFQSSPPTSVTVYLVVTLVTLALALATVAAQCLRTAASDPVLSLRYE